MAASVHPGSFQYPAFAGNIPPSSPATLDSAIHTLQSRKDAWVAATAGERITLLERLIRDFLAVQDRWAAAEVQAKGLDPHSPVASEEWLLGPYPIMRNLRLLRQSLHDIATYGRPKIPGPVTTRPTG